MPCSVNSNGVERHVVETIGRGSRSTTTDDSGVIHSQRMLIVDGGWGAMQLVSLLKVEPFSGLYGIEALEGIINLCLGSMRHLEPFV